MLYTQGRHIKDILRSLSHELVHHHQNCRGDFDGDITTNEGYAQNDEHLREMEREAYECGNMIFRDWEDNLKSKGGKPLFTSTSQYVPPPTSDVAGIYIREGETKKMKLNESTLRDIIRGVIQEMFNDDPPTAVVISTPIPSSSINPEPTLVSKSLASSRGPFTTPPTAPKIEINATPIPPQQAPAPAPIREPNKPERSFFVLA